MAPKAVGTLKRPAASAPIGRPSAKSQAAANAASKATATGKAKSGRSNSKGRPSVNAPKSKRSPSLAKAKSKTTKAKGKAKEKGKRKLAAAVIMEEEMASKKSKTTEAPVFLSFPGAGGSRSRHAVLEQFGTLTPVSFHRVPNLTSIKRETPFLEAIVAAAKQAADKFGDKHPIYLVGHSFGSRAIAHTLLRKDVCCELPRSFAGAIFFGYPLVHPKQARQDVLKALDPGIPLLFLSGCRDKFMGDFSLLKKSLGFPSAAPGEIAVATDAPRRLLMALEGCGHGLECSQAREERTNELVKQAVKAFLLA